MSGPIVVTGAGLCTSAGDALSAVLGALAQRRPLAQAGADGGPAAAAMTGFDAKRYIDRRGVRDLSRASQLACAAAAGNARGLSGIPVAEIGVASGSAWGSISTVIDFEHEAHLQGVRFVDPILFTETVSNVPAGQIAILYGWSAFNVTVSSGSASGLAAIQQALVFLEEERGAVAIAGGADELSPRVLRALARRGEVASAAGSLPLAAARSGPIGGEGACYLTLEPRDHAMRRGVPPLAAIRGAAARYVPERSGSGAARASLAALIRELCDGNGGRSSVDLVVLSASGSIPGDLEEAGAVLDVFGGGPAAPPVIAPKSILGETWGASGAIAVGLAIEIMRTGTIPGAAEGVSLAPELAGLNLPEESLRRVVRNALILDRTDAGHQLGLVISPGEAA